MISKLLLSLSSYLGSHGLYQICIPKRFTRGKPLLPLLIFQGKLRFGGIGCFISWPCVSISLFVKRGEVDIQ